MRLRGIGQKGLLRIAASQNVLATGGTEDGIKSSIAQFWYTSPDNIELEPIDDKTWKVWQIGDAGVYKLMSSYLVSYKRRRYVFEHLDEPLPPEDPRTPDEFFGTSLEGDVDGEDES